MACGEKGGSTILLCLGLVLVACCHGTIFTKLKALDKLRGNSTLSHGQSTGSALRYGRLFIGRNPVQRAKLKGAKTTKSLLDVDKDYQADMGRGQPKQPEKQDSSWLEPDDAAVEKILKMAPKVECTGDSMKLQVRGSVSTPGSLFFVDRGSHLSPLPLSKLPSSCGYTIRSTRRDLVLAAPYDGCFVSLQEDSYVLPLLWLGLPVRMSCPLLKHSSPNPPMVTCHVEGMVVKMEWTISVAKIKVHLNGNWEPLMIASPRCGFSVVEHPEGVVISVRYTPCLAKKDGMFTLELAGDVETKISCPSLAPAQLEPTKSPSKGPEQQTKTPSEGVYFSRPSHSSASIHSPEPLKNLAQPAVPQETGFPQTPEEPTEKPSPGPKDMHQPQLPYFPFYHNFFYPSPSNLDQTVIPAHVPLKPWAAQPEQIPIERENPQPQATHQPNGQQKLPFYPFPFYDRASYPDSVPPASRPQLKPLPPTAPPVVKKPPVTKPPKGKLQEYLLPNPSWPPQEPVKPFASQPEGREHRPLYPIPAPEPSKSPQPEAPQGQVYLPFYPNPFYPQPKPDIKPTTKPTTIPEPSKSPQPEAPQSQVYLPFYPNLFYPQPEPDIKPTTKPTAISEPSKSPQPEAPQSQVHLPFYPNPFYPQPEIHPSKNPTAVPKAPATETPTTYHQPFKIPGAGADSKASAEKSVPSEWPTLMKPSEGQPPLPFNPYYHPLQPQLPQPVTLPPATFMQQPQHVTIPSSGHTPQESTNSLPSNGGIVPKDPQLGSNMPPVYCSPFCPSGFSNCCPQIAFHQHLHHIVPAGPATKDVPSVYTGLPFLPSVAYSGFASGFGPTPLPLKPTEATTASTFAPVSHQFLQSGNEKLHFQPPDGNPAALPGSNPSKPTNPEQQIYSYFVPNLQYPYLPYQPQQEESENLPQRPSPADYSVPSKIQSPGNEPVNPMVPYNIQLQNQQNMAWDMNNPSGPNLMSFISHLQQQDSADGQGPTFKKVVVPNSNSTQPQTRHEQTVNAHSEPKTYVLLQHGPPGREPSSFSQNLSPSQEKPQRPKWLGKGMPYPLPDVNLIPRPGGKSENLPFLVSAPSGPHFVPLHQDPSISMAHSKPMFFNSFKDLWKPMTLQGTSTRIPPHIPGKLFQQWSSAAEQQEGRKQE
uniref:proline-rich extensin-like protein EPR1 n=1 Tax=Scatophagus argus TaxID=75038 RepID=UPI001ED863EE|nr:proline-rich extensin-like protein EPR1 [Scatophagus argus]